MQNIFFIRTLHNFKLKCLLLYLFFLDRAVSKIKTNRSVSKRFRITGSGKLKRAKGSKSHLLTSKSAKRKNQLAKNDYVRPVIAKKLKAFIAK